MNYDEAQPARTELLALGNVQGVLPSVAGPHTLVVRGFLDVPESGR